MPPTNDRLSVDLEVAKLEQSLARIKTFDQALVNTDANIKRLSAGTSFAGSFDRQLTQATARHRKFVQDIKRQGAGLKDSDFGSSLAGGLGVGGGSFGSVAGQIIGAGLVTGAVASLAAAKEADDANRVLRAGAIETGIAYDKLAAKADAFGDRVKLSNTEGQRTFAQLANFANAAGRTDKLDEFQKRFADLAAAKGINAGQLGDISRQLNALTDEATDKLLNANPSAFYDAFAKSLNKTAEQLTDAEKRAAVFDAVLKKGALYDGQAESRAKGFAGQVDELKKQIADLGAETGKALVPLAQFALNSGKLPESFFRTDAERAAIADNARILGEARTKEAVAFLRKSDADIAAARANPSASRDNFILAQINPAKGFFSQIDRQKAITEATANADKFIADLKTRLGRGLSSGSVDIARFANAEFRKNINLFDLDTREKFVADFSKAFDEGFRKVLSNAKTTVPQLRKTLAEINNSADLTTNDRSGLSADFEKAINAAVNAGKKRVEELGKSTDELFKSLFANAGQNNPFVSVFSEAEQQIEKTRLAVAALSPELQKTALDLTERANALTLFSTRLDQSLAASDLRASAQKFRGQGDSTRVTPADFERAVQSAIARDSGFGGGRLRGALSVFERQQLFEGEQAAGLRGLGQSERSIVSFQARQRLRNGADTGLDEARTVQDNLERQLKIIQGLRPENDQERQVADRRIIALTESLSPSQLSDRQNNAAAGAREREAARIEASENAARIARAAQLTTQNSIDANIKALLKIAQSDGLTGVIRIINDAEDSAKTVLGKRPTARDTETGQNL